MYSEERDRLRAPRVRALGLGLGSAEGPEQRAQSRGSGAEGRGGCCAPVMKPRQSVMKSSHCAWPLKTQRSTWLGLGLRLGLGLGSGLGL